MSSKLQLDVGCLSCCGGAIWWTLTNERQAWCYLQVKLCDPCLSTLYVPWCEKVLYRYSSFPFLSFLLAQYVYVMGFCCVLSVSLESSSRLSAKTFLFAWYEDIHCSKGVLWLCAGKIDTCVACVKIKFLIVNSEVQRMQCNVCAAEITPAGTYFNLKLAMLLSLVAEAHEVLHS